MERFGTDKPDVRFGMELVDLTEVFAATEFQAFAGADAVKGIRVPGEGDMTRAAARRARPTGPSSSARRASCGCASRDGGALESPVAQVPVRGRAARRSSTRSARDAGRPAADRRGRARRWCDHVLGTLRLDLGRPPVHEGGLHFLWVVDFPLFEALDDDGRPIPAHHPFTMPHPDDLEPAATSGDALLDVRSQAYDLVLNGWELGSGSVRIHRPDMQQRIFSLLGIDAEEAQATLRLPARRVPLRRAAARRASRSASTASSRSSPARRTSARSSRSRRPSRAPTR